MQLAQPNYGLKKNGLCNGHWIFKKKNIEKTKIDVDNNIGYKKT